MRARARLAIAAMCAAVAVAGAACGSDSSDDPATSAATTAAAASGPCAGGVLPTAEASSRSESYDAPAQVLKDGCDYSATMTTNLGEIEIALDPEAAPETVNSFVFLATQGYFDGLTFHRVVPGFVIQGGDPTGTGTGGPGYTIPDELPAEPGYAEGAVAMANAGPNTSGSQFFIVTGDASFLPNAYSLFGTVTEGLDVAKEIEGLADPNADPNDPGAQSPTAPAVIETVRIAEN
ncbi:MAG: peptidylprolyl isomerase [Thermoleophilia bacterium]